MCVFVCSHLNYGASVPSIHPENTVTYSTDNSSQKNCGFFSETALLRRSSTPSVEGHVQLAICCGKLHMCIIVFTMWHRGFCTLVHSLLLLFVIGHISTDPGSIHDSPTVSGPSESVHITAGKRVLRATKTRTGPKDTVS